MSTMEMEQEKAAAFVGWYCNLMENHKERMYAYMAPGVTFHWFGRTCEGVQMATKLLKNLHHFKHVVENIEPRKNISHRNIRQLRPKVYKEEIVTSLPYASSKRNYTEMDTFVTREMNDGGDHLKPSHTFYLNNNSNNDEEIFMLEDLAFSDQNITTTENGTPTKSTIVIDLNVERGAGDGPQIEMKYVVVTGYLEFSPIPSSSSTPTTTSKNRQFLKMKIAYTEDLMTMEYTIWYVIYESKSKCRRNLLTEFQNAHNEEGN